MPKYVVLTDAVVVTTGKKGNGRAPHTRVNRGGVITGTENGHTISTLLAKGAVLKVKSQEELDEVRADLLDPKRSRLRLTVAKSRSTAIPDDDPVAEVLTETVPLPAGAAGGLVDPGNLTTADLETSGAE